MVFSLSDFGFAVNALVLPQMFRLISLLKTAATEFVSPGMLRWKKTSTAIKSFAMLMAPHPLMPSFKATPQKWLLVL